MSAHTQQSGWGVSLGLAFAACAARVAFLHAGPDAPWPQSLHYRGDSLTWLQSVLAERAGVSFEAGLPLRPPGTTWLLDALWDGTPGGIEALKRTWVALGALAVLAFHRALRAPFGARVAAIAAGLAALSSGGLMLSTALNNEAPYLLLVLLSMWVLPLGVEASEGPEASGGASRARLTAFALLHAAATLVRAEHVLFFLPLTVYLAMGRPRSRARGAAWRKALLVALVFVLALVPWHLSLWGAVARFNAGEVPRDPAADRALAALEARTDHIAWEPAARARAESLPAFTRRSAQVFVAATVQHRGGGVVGPAELGALQEAYGTWPRALGAHPFVATYGALNFGLANHPRAAVGFSRAPLEVAPPLSGGAARFPPQLVAAMPPARFSFEYPPHLALFNDGYRSGVAWIRSAPADWARLAAARAGVFWSGAALGFTGYGLPLGASGLRRAVDLVTPVGAAASAWRWFLLAACGVGLASCMVRRPAPAADGSVDGSVNGGVGPGARAALVPWLLFAASKLAAAVAFFGYARQGVQAQPLVHLLLALALARWVAPRLGRRAAWTAGLLLALGLGLELVRGLRGVAVEVDGQAVGAFDPIPAEDHAEHTLVYRARTQK